MKKYEKPEIMFEDFSLSVNIAAGCAVQHDYADGICAITGTGMPAPIVFDIDVAGTECLDDGDDNTEYNGLCYHNPGDKNNLFVSG